jgi:hypothetical protein
MALAPGLSNFRKREMLPDDYPVEQLPLKTMAKHALLHGQVVRVGDIRALSDQELMRFPNFGRISLKEVRRLTERIEPFRAPGFSNFRKRDLEQAIAVLQKAGIEIARIEIERGKLIVFAGKPGEPPQPVNDNPWKSAHL